MNSPSTRRSIPDDYRTLRIEDFYLKVKAGVDIAWLPLLIGSLHELPPAPHPGRQWAFIAVSPQYKCPESFVKTYLPTDRRSRSLEGRQFFRRWMPGCAAKEGKSYCSFHARSLPVPELFAFGEEWKGWTRRRGIVILEAVRGPSVQDVLRKEREGSLILEVFGAIAEIHSCGLCHGDAHLPNFLWVGGRIRVVDLERSRRFCARRQRRDLINIMTSFLVEVEDAELLEEGLAHYRRRGLRLPFEVTAGIEEARERAELTTSNARRRALFEVRPPPVMALGDFEKRKRRVGGGCLPEGGGAGA